MDFTLGTKITTVKEANALPLGTSCVFKYDYTVFEVAATKHERGWHISSDWGSVVPVAALLPMTVVYYPGALTDIARLSKEN